MFTIGCGKRFWKRFYSWGVVSGLTLAFNLSSQPIQQPQVSTILDSLRIQVPLKVNHRFTFTNQIAAFWYGETRRQNQRPFQGYTILEQLYLKDYQLWRDDRPLERHQAQEIALFPDRLVRSYPQLIETHWFVDSLNTVVVEARLMREQSVMFEPLWNAALGSIEWRVPEDEPIVLGKLEKPIPGRPDHFLIAAWVETGERLPPQLDTQHPRVGFRGKGTGFLVVLFDTSRTRLLETYRELRDRPEVHLKRRSRRLQQWIDRNRLNTPDPQINRAFHWALISLADLVTHQRGPGIWAGLPWFNNYWGRDSFISFTGALLCTGDFSLAREILLSFSRFQDTRPASPYFGRIPNRVRLNEIIYNTADGTPWFVWAAEKYVHYSGDTLFIEEIFPVLKRAMEGALANYVDEYGFLTHGDAETWMDAVGPDGPWSPRGNRAVEIQVLWMEQLRISSEWARYLGYPRWASEWKRLEERVRRQFLREFWDATHQRLYDHLNADHFPDTRIRPNAIFALTLPQKPLLSGEQQRAVLKEIVEKLTYPWGVASLSQTDPNFHPFHHYAPFYVPDAAYHNGLVWTWLAGPVISALFRWNSPLGFQLLEDISRQILQRDGLGSQSELLEAWPRPGSHYPLVSGTVSQAWNLAEYIRNWREDVLGIRPELDRDRLQVRPTLPVNWDRVDFRFRLGTTQVMAHYRQSQHAFTVRLRSDRLDSPLQVEFQLPIGNERVAVSVIWENSAPLEIRVQKEARKMIATVNDQPVRAIRRLALPRPLQMAFCQPDTTLDVPALKGPAYPLLSGPEVTRRPGRFAEVLFDVRDPAGDDRGPEGTYVYPTNPHFRPGIFDARRVKIRKDRQYYYFDIQLQNLVNPGWHPESGFQLTFLAIALNFGDRAGVRTTRVGMNARYRLPVEYAYNFIIYVGNGLQVQDARGRIRCAYYPTDTRHPIGFVDQKRIRFAIPVQFLSDAPLRSVVVLVGGQDDHGGGGMGEFRHVGKTAGEWQGGGADSEQAPTVYDVVRTRR
ncbi:MAG: hypothetical protein GXO78_00680 [Calditrichaeota bacterium]|nr:hypothetical protein [Calditrichota bacterium]